MEEKIIEIKEVEPDYTNAPGNGPYWGGYIIKTNLQEINLLIDYEGQCCEQWGYFFCYEDVRDFIGATIVDLQTISYSGEHIKWLEKFVNVNDEETNIAMYRIVTNIGNLDFVLYNVHNGYYNHEILVNGAFKDKRIWI